ncbi:MAG: molybdate ABC transporter substrate-binding protein [Rhodospirillales bacterium]|nr:molybdate ABC transporter substrate-binding protein [Rhodospirillales bacterium]MBT6826998.1 molybdate ABC transporter substrate-binding protein [Rhodospirillales bacterium]MBT7145887.1 molybdate ABC transporter substrate-binding protein [Rhodospirillales bacterium]
MVESEEITIFAAASLTDAVTEIGNGFSADYEGQTVRYVFAASSTLARQIIAGAPANIFISANQAWMHATVSAGVITGDTVEPVAGNQLVLVTAPEMVNFLPANLPTTVGPGFPLAPLLAIDDQSRLAIGDPAHVPAGQYARQALERLGLWQGVSNRLAPMPHVRAALNLVVRGEAALGIVYASDLSLTPTVRVVATFPTDAHLPITYLAGVVKSDQMDAAYSFLSYLTSPEAVQVFKRHGFSSILASPG